MTDGAMLSLGARLSLHVLHEYTVIKKLYRSSVLFDCVDSGVDDVIGCLEGAACLEAELLAFAPPAHVMGQLFEYLDNVVPELIRIYNRRHDTAHSYESRDEK